MWNRATARKERTKEEEEKRKYRKFDQVPLMQAAALSKLNPHSSTRLEIDPSDYLIISEISADDPRVILFYQITIKEHYNMADKGG